MKILKKSSATSFDEFVVKIWKTKLCLQTLRDKKNLEFRTGSSNIICKLHFAKFDQTFESTKTSEKYWKNFKYFKQNVRIQVKNQLVLIYQHQKSVH